MAETNAGIQEHQLPHKAIRVSVNNNAVIFLVHEATGAEIKSTAIEQGVAIQQDFNLFRVKLEGGLQPIGDGETVKLHEEEKFRAVAPDDNSGPLAI